MILMLLRSTCRLPSSRTYGLQTLYTFARLHRVFRAAARAACAVLLTGCSLGAMPVLAQEASRDAEITQCLPGEMGTWGDAQDRPALRPVLQIVYDHASAPAWFSEAQVRRALERAAAGWSQCGVRVRILGTAEMQPGQDVAPVSVRWSDIHSRGNFGLANWTQQSLTLGPAAFALLQERNPAHDARETLQMVISHELGHLMGLMSHSRRCVDVTSSYDNGKGDVCTVRDRALLRTVTEYRATLPTACDIARCRIANGLPPLLPPRPSP
jgi:hypothetical protein